MPSTNHLKKLYKQNLEKAIEDLGIEDARTIVGQEVEVLLDTPTPTATPTPVVPTPAPAAATPTPAVATPTPAAATPTPAAKVESVVETPTPSLTPEAKVEPVVKNTQEEEVVATPSPSPDAPVDDSTKAEAVEETTQAVDVSADGEIEDSRAATVETPLVGFFEIDVNGSKKITAVLTREGEDPIAASNKKYCTTFDLLNDFDYSICTKKKSSLNKVKELCTNSQDGNEATTLSAECIPQDFKDMYSELTGNALPEEIEL